MGESLMNIGGKKIRKIWSFEDLHIFTKQFIEHQHEYANNWVDTIASQSLIHFVQKFDNNHTFQL